jgi:hypothetical protein
MRLLPNRSPAHGFCDDEQTRRQLGRHHSPLAGTAGRPDAARIRDGLTLGLKRHVIRACCHVPPVGFIAGTTAETYDPELITVSLRR